MLRAERLKSEIIEWNRNTEGEPEARRFEKLRILFWDWFKDLPDDLLAGIFTSFLEKYRSAMLPGKILPLDWLACMGSILLAEYDGAILPHEDWIELKESLSDVAGDIDIDLLTYLMNLILEYKALEI